MTPKHSKSLYSEREHVSSLKEEHNQALLKPRHTEKPNTKKQKRKYDHIVLLILAGLILLSLIILIAIIFLEGRDQQRSEKTNSFSEKNRSYLLEAYDHSPSYAIRAKRIVENSRRSIKTLNAIQGEKKSLHLENQILILRRSLDQTPNFVSLKFALAKTYYSLSQYREANNVLFQVLEQMPDDMDAWLLFANVSLKQKDFAAAEHAALWLIENKAYIHDANTILATAYLTMHKTGLAITYLKKTLEYDEHNLAALNNLGVAYSWNRQYDKAIKIFNKLFWHDEIHAVSYYNLSVCYVQEKQASAVINTLREAAKNFGYPLIAGWIERKEFDPIRSTEPFAKFKEEMKNSSPKKLSAAQISENVTALELPAERIKLGSKSSWLMIDNPLNKASLPP